MSSNLTCATDEEQTVSCPPNTSRTSSPASRLEKHLTPFRGVRSLRSGPKSFRKPATEYKPLCCCVNLTDQEVSSNTNRTNSVFSPLVPRRDATEHDASSRVHKSRRPQTKKHLLPGINNKSTFVKKRQPLKTLQAEGPRWVYLRRDSGRGTSSRESVLHDVSLGGVASDSLFMTLLTGASAQLCPWMPVKCLECGQCLKTVWTGPPQPDNG